MARLSQAVLQKLSRALPFQAVIDCDKLHVSFKAAPTDVVQLDLDIVNSSVELRVKYKQPPASKVRAFAATARPCARHSRRRSSAVCARAHRRSIVCSPFEATLLGRVRAQEGGAVVWGYDPMRMLTHFSGPNIRNGGDFVTTGVLCLHDVGRSLHSCYAHEGNRYVRLTREQLDERRMLCFGPSRFGPSESLPSLAAVGAGAAVESAVGAAAAGESAVGAAAAGKAAEEASVVNAAPNKRQKTVPVVPCVSIQLACLLNEEPLEEEEESQGSDESQGSPSPRMAQLTRRL
jgi:hypothetical protein